MVDEVNNDQEIVSENIKEVVEPIQEERAGEQAAEPSEDSQDSEKSETAEDSAAGSTPNDDRGDAEYVKHVQNWRALREARDKAERERDEAISMLKERGAEQPREADNRQQELTLGDDDLVEGKHLKQGQQQVQNRMMQLEQQLIESKIRGAYPDFDKVVTKDTLGMLRDADPELAESLASNPNLYSQAIAAYKSIKRYGLAGPTYEREKEKVNSNIAKPRTVTSLAPQQGESPLTRANAFANGLTDELKAQMWQEMQDIVKNS